MRTPSVVVDKIFPLEQKMGFSGCHLITYKKKKTVRINIHYHPFLYFFFVEVYKIEIGK